MILSEQIRSKFALRLEQAGPSRRSGFLRTAGSLPDSLLPIFQWLCANSPLSDLLNYPPELFLSCAEHGLFLRENSPFARGLPEDVFLRYVLPLRVNDEELRPCRRLFYDLLAPRVRGLSPEQAILETNYWCAENVTYQSTDGRTISALGAYRSGFGRCGEESVFCVNALRSLGLPARQVYAPRWSHCDDNHAWVEVLCGGQWHYLGACEPEEALDRCWFTGAASRAMLIHSRSFDDPPEAFSRTGATSYLNCLDRYAPVKRLTVLVRDEAGRAAEGAQVSFRILNYAHFVPIASLTTGEDGTATLCCGLGSISVRAKMGGASAELLLAPEAETAELRLQSAPSICTQWEDFNFIAPQGHSSGSVPLTEEQRRRGRERSSGARAVRESRSAAFYDPKRANALAERWGYSPEVCRLLEASCGNFEPLLAFLEGGESEEKERLLRSLTDKDLRDVEPDVLLDALGGFPPRVWTEPLRPNRSFILSFFSEEEKKRFQEEPEKLWDWLCGSIRFHAEAEYEQLYTLPAGALEAGSGSPLSRKVLFAACCRALGIEARLNPVDQAAEYAARGRFIAVDTPERDCAVVLRREAGEVLQYGSDFSLEWDGQALALSREMWEGQEMRLSLRPGEYRLVTSNRLPNGNQYASQLRFRLEAGEERTIRLRRREAGLEEMLADYPLEDFAVRSEADNPATLRELTQDGAVLMWLEEGCEPTEHLLNEILEREEEFRKLKLAFLLQGPEALKNSKLKKVLERLAGARVYYDDFSVHGEALARRLYVEPEKLPLIMIASGELRAVYGCSGYYVGSGEMVLKIVELVNNTK